MANGDVGLHRLQNDSYTPGICNTASKGLDDDMRIVAFKVMEEDRDVAGSLTFKVTERMSVTKHLTSVMTMVQMTCFTQFLGADGAIRTRSELTLGFFINCFHRLLHCQNWFQSFIN